MIKQVKLHMIGVALAAALVSPTVDAHPKDDVTKVEAPNPETSAIAQAFFSRLKSGGGSAAINYAFGLSPLFASKKDQQQAISDQVDSAIKIYGAAVKWERIDAQNLGTSVRRETFIVQHDLNVTRWQLDFIRTPKGWIIGSLNFNDQVQSWF